jgi:hypothetical protein
LRTGRPLKLRTPPSIALWLVIVVTQPITVLSPISTNAKCRDISHFRYWMKVGSETDIPKSINRAVGGINNAVRLSSASLAERTFCNRRTTARRPLTDAVLNNRRAEELQVRCWAERGFGRVKYRSAG